MKRLGRIIQPPLDIGEFPGADGNSIRTGFCELAKARHWGWKYFSSTGWMENTSPHPFFGELAISLWSGQMKITFGGGW
jgi:hypothetical protein